MALEDEMFSIKMFRLTGEGNKREADATRWSGGLRRTSGVETRLMEGRTEAGLVSTRQRTDEIGRR